MSAVRRPLRATVSASAAYVAPQVSFPTEVTYRGYRIEPASQPGAPARAECADVGGKHLVLRAGGKDVLRYNSSVVDPPAGMEPIFARSGYIHPVWTPSGLVISNDFPPNHKHHHGIWMPWTKAQFEGREVNFWEQGYGLGKVECTGIDEKVSGSVFGGFRAIHRFLDLLSRRA